MYFLVGCVLVGGIVFYSRTGNNNSPLASTVSDVNKTSSSGKITVDISSCKPQVSNVYLCPGSALANFGPVTIKNAGQKNTCRITYNQNTGYVFDGSVKNSHIPAGEFLVSVTDTGAIANIVRSSGSQSLTFFVGGSERVVHVMIVDGKDYSRDQCLEI